MKAPCRTCQTSKELEKMLRVRFPIYLGQEKLYESSNYYYFCHNEVCFTSQANKEGLVVYTPIKETKHLRKKN